MAPSAFPELEKDEFLSLLDQKAADWRAVTQMSTSFLAFAGALFAAGVGQKAAFVVVLSPVPLLLGVFHMVRNAKLQLQMVTYLAVFAPAATGASWERDIDVVRPRFWDRAQSRRWIVDTKRRVKDDGLAAHLLRIFSNPSAWHTWLEMTLLIGLLLNLIPLIADGYHSAWCAFALGTAILLLGGLGVFIEAAKLEATRGAWIELWREYHDELEATPPDQKRSLDSSE
jgi:hypothetical protein